VAAEPLAAHRRVLHDHAVQRRARGLAHGDDAYVPRAAHGHVAQQGGAAIGHHHAAAVGPVVGGADVAHERAHQLQRRARPGHQHAQALGALDDQRLGPHLRAAAHDEARTAAAQREAREAHGGPRDLHRHAAVDARLPRAAPAQHDRARHAHRLTVAPRRHVDTITLTRRHHGSAHRGEVRGVDLGGGEARVHVEVGLGGGRPAVPHRTARLLPERGLAGARARRRVHRAARVALAHEPAGARRAQHGPTHTLTEERRLALGARRRRELTAAPGAVGLEGRHARASADGVTLGLADARVGMRRAASLR
jgi:hypothetical protein